MKINYKFPSLIIHFYIFIVLFVPSPLQTLNILNKKKNFSKTKVPSLKTPTTLPKPKKNNFTLLRKNYNKQKIINNNINLQNKNNVNTTTKKTNKTLEKIDIFPKKIIIYSDKSILEKSNYEKLFFVFLNFKSRILFYPLIFIIIGNYFKMYKNFVVFYGGLCSIIYFSLDYLPSVNFNFNHEKLGKYFLKYGKHINKIIKKTHRYQYLESCVFIIGHCLSILIYKKHWIFTNIIVIIIINFFLLYLNFIQYEKVSMILASNPYFSILKNEKNYTSNFKENDHENLFLITLLDEKNNIVKKLKYSKNLSKIYKFLNIRNFKVSFKQYNKLLLLKIMVFYPLVEWMVVFFINKYLNSHNNFINYITVNLMKGAIILFQNHGPLIRMNEHLNKKKNYRYGKKIQKNINNLLINNYKNHIKLLFLINSILIVLKISGYYIFLWEKNEENIQESKPLSKNFIDDLDNLPSYIKDNFTYYYSIMLFNTLAFLYFNHKTQNLVKLMIE